MTAEYNKPFLCSEMLLKVNNTMCNDKSRLFLADCTNGRFHATVRLSSVTYALWLTVNLTEKTVWRSI